MKTRIPQLATAAALLLAASALAGTFPVTFTVPGHVANKGVFVSLIGQNVGSSTIGPGPWVFSYNSSNLTTTSTPSTLTTEGIGPTATSLSVVSVVGFPTSGNLNVSLPGLVIPISYTGSNATTNTFTGVVFANPSGPGIGTNSTVTLAGSILAPTLNVSSVAGFPQQGTLMLQPAPGSVTTSYNVVVSYNGTQTGNATASAAFLNVAPFPGGGNFTQNQTLYGGGPIILMASPQSGNMSVGYVAGSTLWNTAQNAGANTPAINLFPDAGTLSENATYTRTLQMPDYTLNGILSGVAVIGVGGVVPVAAQGATGTLGSPDVSSAANIVYGIFEWGLVNSSGGLDFDVSEVDQVGFPFTVNTVGTRPPPPADPVLGVGLLQDRETLFQGFKDYVNSLDAASQNAFAQCNPDNPDAPYPVNTRITAPQDITGTFLNGAPLATAAAPAGAAGNQTATVWYAVTAMNAEGAESTISNSVMGTSTTSNASLQVTWQPYDYARGYNIYWGQTVTADGANSLISPIKIGTMTGGSNATFTDATPWSHSGTPATPPLNNFGYNALNSYLDPAIKEFFDYYTSNTFVLDDQSTNTTWTGTTGNVTMNGVTYRMLQLTGSAGQWGADHSGSTLNLLEPLFSSNTDNSTLPLPPIVIPGTTAADPIGFSTIQAAQLPFIGNGTIVIDQNGGLWQYNGTGNKYSQGNYTTAGSNANLAGMSLNPTQSATAMAFGAQGVFGNFVGNGTTLDVNDAKNVWNNIVTAIVRGLTPRHISGNWTNVVLPDYWSNQPTIQPASQSAGGNLTVGGTYRYTVSAYGVLGDNSTKETPQSSPATVYLSGANQTITINWTAINPPGGPVGAATAQGLNIYRSQLVSGNWTASGQIASIVNGPTPPATSFTDSGTATPGVAPSVVWYARNSLSDHYAGYFKLLNVSINGLSYGYAYDDKGSVSTNVQMDPSGVTDLVITLNPWKASPAPGLPTIEVNGTLNPFTTTNGTASASQTFTANGTFLIGNISVNTPPNFEISTNGTYSGTLSLVPTNGTVADTLISVRLAASAPVGTFVGPILLSSSNATTQSVTANGTVTSAQTPYATWISSYPSLTGNATLGTADPDGDGFNNNMEFAFDGDPTVPTPNLLGATSSGGNMTITFVARNTSPAGVAYQVQSTTNLVTGFNPDGSVNVIPSPDQSGILLPAQYQRRQFTVSTPAKKVFYRVQGTLQP